MILSEDFYSPEGSTKVAIYCRKLILTIIKLERKNKDAKYLVVVSWTGCTGRQYCTKYMLTVEVENPGNFSLASVGDGNIRLWNAVQACISGQETSRKS